MAHIFRNAKTPLRTRSLVSDVRILFYLGIVIFAVNVLHSQQSEFNRAPRVEQVASAAHEFTKADKVLLGGVAAFRIEDVFSTRYSLAHGGHESQNFGFIANHTSVDAAYSVGVAFGQYEFSRWAIRHRMHWLATATEVMHFGYEGFFATRNWVETNQSKPGFIRLGH